MRLLYRAAVQTNFLQCSVTFQVPDDSLTTDQPSHNSSAASLIAENGIPSAPQYPAESAPIGEIQHPEARGDLRSDGIAARDR